MFAKTAGQRTFKTPIRATALVVVTANPRGVAQTKNVSTVDQ